MKRWKIIVSVVLAIAIVAAFFAFYPRSSKGVAVTPAGQIVEVKTGTVQLTVSASGSVSQPRQSKLTFGSTGVVAKVNVRTGDRVKQGQVLAKLDTSDLERSLARAEADLKLAVERQKNQYTTADIAKAQAAVDSAKANLAKAEADLNATVLERASAQAAVDSAKASLAKAGADLNATVLERASAQAAVDSAKASLAKAEADLNATVLERSSAQATAEQAKQNLGNLQKRALLDIWDAENVERKAADNYLNVAKQVRISTDPTSLSASPLQVAWQEWQKAQLQLIVAKQTLDNAMVEAQNSLDRAQDNLARLMPGGSTLQQREAAVAAARASLDNAQDDLSRLMPGGSTLQQREAAVAAAKASLDRAKDDLSRLVPGGSTLQQREATLATARASLDKAQEELANTKAGGSSVDILSQEIAVSKLQTTVADAKEALSNATIVAAYDGTVNDVNIKEGDTASASGVAIVLIDTSVKEMQATIDEVDVGQLRLGQDANITFDALPDLAAKGRVVAVAPDAKVQSGVVGYAITVAIIPPDTGAASPQTGATRPQTGAASPQTGATRPQTGAASSQGQSPRQGGSVPSGRVRVQGASYESLKGGMTALAEIVIQQKVDVLLVPNRAIKTSGQNRTVQVVLPSGLTETRKVTTGISDGQNTEIVDGLSLGEKVLIPVATKPAAPAAQQQIPKVPGMPRF